MGAPRLFQSGFFRHHVAWLRHEPFSFFAEHFLCSLDYVWLRLLILGATIGKLADF